MHFFSDLKYLLANLLLHYLFPFFILTTNLFGPLVPFAFLLIYWPLQLYTVFKTALFTYLCYKNVVIQSPELEPVAGAGSQNRSRSRLDRLHNTCCTQDVKNCLKV